MGNKQTPLVHDMTFEVRDIDSVSYHPRNPRQGDIGAICESLDANGFFGAVLVQQSTNFILAGEHRHKSLKARGGSVIPCLLINVDDEQALRIMLADNATADQADYDRAALPALLEAILEGTGTLQGTGYTEEKLNELLNDLQPRERATQPEAENKKEAPNLDPGEDRYQEQYGVIVICANEAEQERVFTQLSLEYSHVKIVVT